MAINPTNVKNTALANRITQIFDDLITYRAFCVEYGYKFDEADLNSVRSYVFRQYQKFLAGKFVKDQWELDAERFKTQPHQTGTRTTASRPRSVR